MPYSHTHTHTPPYSVDVIMYGWFGEFQPRDSYGELSGDPVPVQYVEYDEEVFEMIADSNTFNPLTFRVIFIPKAETTPPLRTDGPTVEPGGGISTVLILGVAVGGGLGGLIILLIIVLVCVFGRKRDKSKPKGKKRRR